MIIGFDTGFFVRLLQGSAAAADLWNRVAGGEVSAVISCLTLYELDRQGLKGLLPRQAADTLLEELPHVCRVVWIDDPALLRRAARIAHGNGLAMADAIILSSLIEAEAESVYTTDADLAAYSAGPRIELM